MEAVELRTRCSDRRVLETLALKLVETRLAACSHVRGPIESWYHWDGAVENAREWELDAVTTPALLAACCPPSRSSIRTSHQHHLETHLLHHSVRRVGSLLREEYLGWVRRRRLSDHRDLLVLPYLEYHNGIAGVLARRLSAAVAAGDEPSVSTAHRWELVVQAELLCGSDERSECI